MIVDKVRILNVLMEYKNIKTKAEFARFIGVTPQGIATWYARNSFDINKIANAIPEIRHSWLLTGEGEMLKETTHASDATHRKKASVIKYWVDVDSTAGGVELFDDTTSAMSIDISIPEFRDCTDAVNIYGDSMHPLYRNGQILILKKWTENFIEYGNIYLIITQSGNRMVKYLRRSGDETHVLCASENKDFDPFEIEKSDILHLFLVKGGISKNTI